MLKCEAKTLDGETIEFEIWQFSHAYPDDDVAYIQQSLGSVPVYLSSIVQAAEQNVQADAAPTGLAGDNKNG